MQLKFLGDALDHWKGSVFEWLQREGIIRRFSVDAMASDASSWSEEDWHVYVRLLRLDRSQLISHSQDLAGNRLAYFDEIQHPGDLFLDPDTGIATGSVKQVSQYVRPGELLRLLSADESRVVAVYQHGARSYATIRDRLDGVVSSLRRPDNPLCCMSYECGTVAMLFFSANCWRIEEIAYYLRSALGRHGADRICQWGL